MNGSEEGGQYYISQTSDQERFTARNGVFSWECLNIFATGCMIESSHLPEFLSASYVSFEQTTWDSVTHYMCASTDIRGVLSDNNSHGMANFVH